METSLTADGIMEKLGKLSKDQNNVWSNWSVEERRKLLNMYLIIVKNEAHIFDLIWQNHECDSWEDIFRDYDMTYLVDKAVGVEIAIDTLNTEPEN